MLKEHSPPSPLRILHLEDSELDHELVRRALDKSHQSYAIERVETLAEFQRRLQSSRFDVILADYRLPGFTAFDAWQILLQQSERTPFILLSGAIGEAAVVTAIKMGISDYLAKEDIKGLAQVIRRALEMNGIRRAKEAAELEIAASQKQLADFAEHLQITIEQERAAIARKIHDDIGGALAAVRFDLAWLDRHSVDAPARGHIAGATAMLQQAIGASQRIMMNLRPAILDQGLVAAVQWLVSDFATRTGIDASVRAEVATPQLSKAIELVAYRTAQEALTNIVKHAQCAKVRIELTDARNVLTLEIKDDGKGIAAGEPGKARAFGLRGLRERAEQAGGWLDVSSQVGAGTSIILSVPLDGNPVAAKQKGQP